MIKTREKDLKYASHSYQGAGNTEVRCRTCSDMNILARIGCFVKIFSQKNRAINRTSQKKREKRHISFEMCLFSFVKKQASYTKCKAQKAAFTILLLYIKKCRGNFHNYYGSLL